MRSLRSQAFPRFSGWLARHRHRKPGLPRQLALIVVAVAVLFGCGSTTAIVAQQGGKNSGTPTTTTAPHATATAAPKATPTHAPAPPPKPTATNAPQPPNIAGSYGGFYGSYSQNGSYPMQLTLSQSGGTLTGTTTEESYTYSDSGTIGLNGHFTLAEKDNGSFVANLVGSLVFKNAGGAQLEGTWNNGGADDGTWGVGIPAEPAYIAGTYTGTFTESGSTYPMTLQLTEFNGSLSGTTTEGSYTYTDNGTINADKNGTFTIGELDNGSFVANLVGSITSFGQLGGTWNTTGTPLGNWSVTIN